MSEISSTSNFTAERILLTGGQGKTSSRIAQLAAKEGYLIRTAGRRAPENPIEHAEHVMFDWYDPSTYEPALSGIHAVYLVAPPDLHPEKLMIPFIRQAIHMSVRRFVLLSSASVSANDPVFGPVHRYLQQHAPEWAVLRPSYFMQNFSEAVHAATIQASRQILTATGAGKVGFVDAENIAEVGFQALVRLEPFNEELIITGPHSLSYQEAAEIIGGVSGREVAFVSITEKELKESMVEVGLPQAYASFLANLDTRIRTEGIEDQVTDTVLRVTGKEPRSFEQFVRDELPLFV
ncbi:NAD(P)H-binding protein [Saccharibacillus sp. JS10]|uniref:NmrA family NAD(P)-binding protein n=1 Tax=Saccharibacillus sp. JS10 TaxID=2950552 RepID=UPI00210EDCDB|nr:NAD(P)H-binding protein [Saccharibacillus sp. JS10]MCQ4088645.1 NAD(P)H-binding protein [Saccharibacillus sp. JS10]